MGGRFQVHRHRPTRDAVVEAVRNAIFAGELKPGQRLVEAEIAQQMGISRAPVREAIRQLEQEGLVVSLPYRETRVAATTEEEVREVLLPIRIVLESFALKRLIAQGSGKILQELERIATGMREAAEAQDHYRTVELDIEFHRTLIEASGHPHPMRIWTGINSLIRGAFVIGTTVNTLTATAKGHEHLLTVIRTGDLGAAEQALRHHINEMAPLDVSVGATKERKG